MTDLHFVHDGRSDDEPTVGILERVSSSRDRNAVLWDVSMSVYDVVFAAHQYTGGAIITIR